MALGGDPARFWGLTPRLYSLEVDGFLDRHRAAKSLAWMAAMLPHMKKPVEHDEFVFGRDKPKALRVRDWSAAWDKVDRALAANKARRPA